MFPYSHEGKLPQEFDLGLVQSIFASVGGDPQEFAACLSAGTYADAVKEIERVAGELGVLGTPTFFVDGWAIPGAYPYEVFRGVIESLLRKGQ
jgi:predicted DsbA family dithiol-disulfide isomerase